MKLRTENGLPAFANMISCLGELILGSNGHDNFV